MNDAVEFDSLGKNSHFTPRNTICSHSQASVSMMIMLGKANPNHDAKFMMSGFSGNSL